MSVDPQLLAQVLSGLGDAITIQDRAFATGERSVVLREDVGPDGLRLQAKPFPLEAPAAAVRGALDGKPSAARVVEP